MKWLIIVGLFLGSGTITTNRFIHPIPDWLQITLYSIAIILIIAGMLIQRKFM